MEPERVPGQRDPLAHGLNRPLGHTEAVATLDEAIERSAAPAYSRRAIERLVDVRPEAAKLFADDPELVAAAVAITGLSRSLSTRKFCARWA